MVEFAIVLPLLLILVLGAMEFGYAWTVSGSMSNAARVAAREFAINGDSSTAVTAAQNAARPFTVPAGEITVTPATCAPGQNVVVTITHQHTMITGFFGTTVTISGKGTMRCGG